jgi:hypothetical protein
MGATLPFSQTIDFHRQEVDIVPALQRCDAVVEQRRCSALAEIKQISCIAFDPCGSALSIPRVTSSSSTIHVKWSSPSPRHSSERLAPLGNLDGAVPNALKLAQAPFIRQRIERIAMPLWQAARRGQLEFATLTTERQRDGR